MLLPVRRHWSVAAPPVLMTPPDPLIAPETAASGAGIPVVVAPPLSVRAKPAVLTAPEMLRLPVLAEFANVAAAPNASGTLTVCVLAVAALLMPEAPSVRIGLPDLESVKLPALLPNEIPATLWLVLTTG